MPKTFLSLTVASHVGWIDSVCVPYPYCHHRSVVHIRYFVEGCCSFPVFSSKAAEVFQFFRRGLLCRKMDALVAISHFRFWQRGGSKSFEGDSLDRNYSGGSKEMTRTHSAVAIPDRTRNLTWIEPSQNQSRHRGRHRGRHSGDSYTFLCVFFYSIIFVTTVTTKK